MKRFDRVVLPQVAWQAPFHPTPIEGFNFTGPWCLTSTPPAVSHAIWPHLCPCLSDPLCPLPFCPTQWAWAVLTLARVCKFLWLPKSLPLRGEQPDQPRPTAPVLLLTAELFPRAHADGIEVPIPMQQKVAPNTWPSL